LDRASQLDPDYLRESVTEPSKFIVPGYQQAQLELTEGKILQGRLLYSDDNFTRLQFVDENGHQQIQEITANQIKNVNVFEFSTMPPYRLNSDDLESLISFLASLDGDSSHL